MDPDVDLQDEGWGGEPEPEPPASEPKPDPDQGLAKKRGAGQMSFRAYPSFLDYVKH